MGFVYPRSSRTSFSLYVWLDLKLDGREPSKSLGWLYWLPNPLFPFIWWRVALPGNHPEVLVEVLAD